VQEVVDHSMDSAVHRPGTVGKRVLSVEINGMFIDPIVASRPKTCLPDNSQKGYGNCN
jgi:hypothetical protein